MSYSQFSTAWLSDDMARALAAMYPPLTTSDVCRAAQKLAAGLGANPLIDDFLRLGADLISGRQVVEALAALREAGADESDVISSFPQGGGVHVYPEGELAVADRVFQELVQRLSSLISPPGAHAIVSRAIRLAAADFSFLESVRRAPRHEADFASFRMSLRTVSPSEASESVMAILRHVFILLNALIGDDLTNLLAAGVVFESVPGPEASVTGTIARGT